MYKFGITRSYWYIVLSATMVFLTVSAFGQSRQEFRIAVDSVGAITVDGKSTRNTDVDSLIRNIANQHGRILYYRKGARNEPDPVTLKILRASEKYDVPITLCGKPDFSDAPHPGERWPNPQATALSTPTPEYPDEAKKKHLRGSGYFDLHIDPYTGAVLSVHVKQSTGQSLLDNSAITAFKHWRFKPNAISSNRVRVPVTF